MVNQGSHGLVGHGVEGHRTVSCGRQGSRRKVRGERLVEGVMVNQGSHVLDRPGWSCRVGATQSSRGTA